MERKKRCTYTLKNKTEKEKESNKNIPKAGSKEAGESRHNKVSSQTTEQLLSLVGSVCN